MGKSLYIVSRGLDDSLEPLLTKPLPPDTHVSVILIHNAVTRRELSAHDVYVLSDDAVLHQVNSPFSSVSYEEMLRMIFQADNVVVV